MKLSHTYKGYPLSERFNLDRKFFSKIVISNGEASFFVKALLLITIYLSLIAIAVGILTLWETFHFCSTYTCNDFLVKKRILKERNSQLKNMVLEKDILFKSNLKHGLGKWNLIAKFSTFTTHISHMLSSCKFCNLPIGGATGVWIIIKKVGFGGNIKHENKVTAK